MRLTGDGSLLSLRTSFFCNLAECCWVKLSAAHHLSADRIVVQ